METSIHKKALGSVLYERVCDHLDLLEKEFFGLTYRDPLDGTLYWLDVNKTVSHQKRRGKWEFEFGVRFFPPDPTVMKESLSRYLVCLQIRKDIASGKLPCTFATQAVLGSFIVQADLGDWEPEEHGEGIGYIRDIPFAPDQSVELLEKIAELHKDRKGMTPEEAELQYLEYAKKIALYGIHLHQAKDSDYVDIQIGIGASGISVYRENLRINRFVWPKVLKISYRRNKFLLRIRPGEFETFESWIVFKLPSNKLAKRLWKQAVEHHAFLRLREASEARRGILPRFGSKYRYSGRTLYEARVNTADRQQPFFERTASKQYLNNNPSRSMDELPTKRPNQLPPHRDPNLSITSADESFDTYTIDSPTERAVENSRIIHSRINEEDESRDLHLPDRNTFLGEDNHVTREETRVIRQEGDRVVTEIKVEHRFVRREVQKEDDITERLPSPPEEDPGKKRKAEKRGVPTALAAVLSSSGPSAKVHGENGPRGSSDSENDAKSKPAPKQKPPKAPKPDVKKKPTVVREMDL